MNRCLTERFVLSRMAALKYRSTSYGSTSTFYRVRPGVILKSPTQVWEGSSHYQELTKELAHSFSAERQIFDKLGDHPRIVKFIHL
jgi:hypothetical protein